MVRPVLFAGVSVRWSAARGRRVLVCGPDARTRRAVGRNLQQEQVRRVYYMEKYSRRPKLSTIRV
jgi:hypothetical protein